MTKDEMLRAIGSDWPFALECYKFVTGDPDSKFHLESSIIPDVDNEEDRAYQAAFLAVTLCLGKTTNFGMLTAKIEDIDEISQRFMVAMSMRNLVFMGMAYFGEDDENGWPTIVMDQECMNKIRRHLGQEAYNIEFCKKL